MSSSLSKNVINPPNVVQFDKYKVPQNAIMPLNIDILGCYLRGHDVIDIAKASGKSIAEVLDIINRMHETTPCTTVSMQRDLVMRQADAIYKAAISELEKDGVTIKDRLAVAAIEALKLKLSVIEANERGASNTNEVYASLERTVKEKLDDGGERETKYAIKGKATIEPRLDGFEESTE